MKIEDQTRVTLSGVHYAAFQSEETYCFSATLLFDGQRICTVSNDGHGGAHRYDAFKGETMDVMRSRLARVEAFAATLEPQDLGDGIQLHADVDIIVTQKVADWLAERDFDRALETKWLFTMEGDKELRYVRKSKVQNPQIWARHFESHWHTKVTFLHELPRDRALALYRGAAQ